MGGSPTSPYYRIHISNMFKFDTKNQNSNILLILLIYQLSEVLLRSILLMLKNSLL